MEIRKMLNAVVADAGGVGGGDGAKEVFEFASVSGKMQEILTVKNETVTMLDNLTHSLEEQVKNNSQSAAYGGDISAFWNTWTGFQDSYAAFAKYIESVDTLVSQAATKNQTLQETINGIMAATQKANEGASAGGTSAASVYTK